MKRAAIGKKQRVGPGVRGIEHAKPHDARGDGGRRPDLAVDEDAIAMEPVQDVRRRQIIDHAPLGIDAAVLHDQRQVVDTIAAGQAALIVAPVYEVDHPRQTSVDMPRRRAVHMRMIPCGHRLLRDGQHRAPPLARPDRVMGPAVDLSRHQQAVPVDRHILIERVAHLGRDLAAGQDDGRAEIALVETRGHAGTPRPEPGPAGLRPQRDAARLAHIEERRHPEASRCRRADAAVDREGPRPQKPHRPKPEQGGAPARVGRGVGRGVGRKVGRSVGRCSGAARRHDQPAVSP